MDFDVKTLKRANRDIDEIAQYKSQFYPDTALRFLIALENALDTVAQNPYMYPEYVGNKKYHRLIVQDYLVFYRIFETSRTVRVYRVLHGKRNIAALL
jgi:addiction module RelE/StbE family toxin